MNFLSLEQVDVKKKRILVRVGYDVPLDEKGNITDNARIKESLSTINYLLKQNAKIILLTHLGRPKGKNITNLSTTKVAQELSLLIKQPVAKLDDCIGKKIQEKINTMKAGEIVLLENVRFHVEEESEEASIRNNFAKQLASLADIYVNEAFSVSHRDSASMSSLPLFLPACAGLNLNREVTTITSTLENPKHPFIAIIGGIKLETKIPVIKYILPKVDKVLLAGAMVFTFYKAQGYEVGNSIVDEDLLSTAKELLNSNKSKIVLPEDFIIAEKIDPKAKPQKAAWNKIPKNMLALDIGVKTIATYKNQLKDAKTVIWNGPLGVYEIEQFAQGTKQIATYLAQLNTTTVIGGGDSSAALDSLGISNKITLISTAGGAALALFSGETLPALEALEESYKKHSK